MQNKLDSAEFRIEIEEATGFVAYEKQANTQQVWYGLSTKLSAFKAMVEDYIPTGTVAYCLDTKTSEMWSKFNKTWY